VDASLGLSRPYNTCQRHGSTARGLPTARFVPSSGFGDPLDGLLPLPPGRAYLIPAAFLGLPLRSFLLAQGGDAFPHHRTRMPLARCDLPERTPARNNGHRLPGFGPRESPWPLTRRLTEHATGCSLGFFPFQGSLSGCLVRVSPATPFSRFADCSSANCSIAGTLGYQSATASPRPIPTGEPTGRAKQPS
jgi:hypothetical protein